MATNPRFPNAQEGIAVGLPAPSHAYYNWFRTLNDAVNNGTISVDEANAEIAALAARVSAIEGNGTAAALLAAMYGTNGVSVFGSIESGVEIRGPDLTGLRQSIPPGMDGQDGEDSYVPGPPGPQGPIGPAGPAGSGGGGGSSVVIYEDHYHDEPQHRSLPAEDLLNIAAGGVQGDILYRDASGWTRLPASTAGNLLATNGAGANPSYITPGAASVGAGAVIGYAKTSDSTIASTASTTIPIDNTKPQNTEGVAYASLDTTITPQFSSSILRVTVHIPWISNTSGTFPATVLAVFRDSTADAVYATLVTIPAAGGAVPATLVFQVTAGSTSATTFKLRWAVSGGTGYFMRTSGSAAVFDTADIAYMEIMEIKQ